MGIATLTKAAECSSPLLHALTNKELKELQQLLLEMTEDVAQVCQEHQIPWSLAGGSALGAIRHKGFIPWDDDVDLSMLRADFERFRQVFPGELQDKYELKVPGDKGYLYHFPKIYRKNTIAQTIQSAPGEPEGVSLDIFILENVSDHWLFRTMHGLLCNALLLVDSVMRMKRCRKNLLYYGANSKKLCRAVKRRAFFAGLFSFLSLERWLKLSDKAFALCRKTDSQYVVIPSGNAHFFGEIFLRQIMEELKETEFAGKRFFMPKYSDYFLWLRYGPNYMKLPPKKDRERHMFIRFDLNPDANEKKAL